MTKSRLIKKASGEMKWIGFPDIKGEKGAFVMVPGGEVLKFGHELEMKEKRKLGISLCFFD